MLFNKNDEKPNDRILYQTKPNLILGCKKAIYGVIILVIILMVSPFIIRFIGEMQVYMISHIKLSLTRYAAIAFFVVILIDIIYIIWNLIGWYSVEYALTDSKIIIKSGVLSTKRNYMPYATIQDINTSQGILAKIFNVGTVSVFSAYDNNQMELKDISNPSEVEEIIFTRMVAPRGFQQPPQMFAPQHQQPNYRETEEFYDEYEPITPITHERNSFSRGEYEYYPEDLGYNDAPRHTYEYEPYDSKYSNSPNNQSQGNHYNRVRDEYSPGNDDYYQNYGNSPNGQSQGNHYNRVRDEYSPGNDDYYQNYSPDVEYNDDVKEIRQNESEDMSETAIKRHFDKFKR